MTLSEFKAWFEGYTEDLKGAPNAAQWKRIQAQVKKIDGTAYSYPVFIDRYRDYWKPYWHDRISYSAAGASFSSLERSAAPSLEASWDSTAAMFAVGKADAALEAA